MIRALVLAALVALPTHAQTAQPYAGEEGRAIATLSEADIAEILAGGGWGLAKPAELNGYPGPAHVQGLADPLGLTEDQRAAVEEIYAAMSRAAQARGNAYVAAERTLDAAFAEGTVDAAALEELLAASAQALATLREVHLAAHLEVAPLLTPHQRQLYQRLRGYAGGAHTGHSGHGN